MSLLIAANKASLEGYQGLAEALSAFVALDMGRSVPRPHYGHTFVEECPDFEAVEVAS